MGCCVSTVSATVPSGPSPSTSAPRGTQRTAPVHVPSQTIPEISPAPSSQPVSRTRSRTRYRSESTQHSGMSSQNPNTRVRMNSAPQPPQSSKSSSFQIYRNRTKSLATDKRTNRYNCSPTSPSYSIQASIEIGRSRYWRNLWSSLNFVDLSLKNCVGLIHVDIIEVWQLDDKNGYLSSDQFKINMSHIVKDLAVVACGASPSSDSYWNGSADKFAAWVYDVYRGKKQENIRCVMGYIVDLIVILDGIFRLQCDSVREGAGNAMKHAAQKVTVDHVRSGRRDSIHRDIRRFVTEAFPIRFDIQQGDTPQKDLVLEKIIDLIRQYCAPP